MTREQTGYAEAEMSENERLMVEGAERLYAEIFEGNSEVVSTGKGRVEVIGNFTDQKLGKKPGMAVGVSLEEGIYCAAGMDPDGEIKVYSEAYKGDGTVSLNPENLYDLEGKPDWVRLVAATLAHLSQSGVELQGMNLALKSDLPQVGGLSSSAALEMAVAMAVMKLNGGEPDKMEEQALAKICWDAETDPVVGSACGYLDQGCSAHKGGCLLTFSETDGQPYAVEDVDLGVIEEAGYKPFLVVGSGRKLTETGYAHKVRLAMGAFDRFHSANNREPEIADVYRGEETPDEVDDREMDEHGQMTGGLYDDWDNMGVSGEARRALQHLLEENYRVEEFVEALNSGDAETALNLINQSGLSSLNNWGVADTCPGVEAVPNLIQLVLALQNHARAGRNMGGGWNETCLGFVKVEEFEEMKAKIAEERDQGITLLDVNIGGGSRVLKSRG